MKTDEQILNELKTASAGLLFMSESDYPFETVSLGVQEMTPATLRQISGEEADAPVEAQSLEEFFRAAVSVEDWRSAAELAAAKKYQALVALLKDNLTGVKVYRIGAVNLAVYIIGQSVAGNWLGLSTRVVET